MQWYIWKRRGPRPNFRVCVFFVWRFFLRALALVFFRGVKNAITILFVNNNNTMGEHAVELNMYLCIYAITLISVCVSVSAAFIYLLLFLPKTRSNWFCVATPQLPPLALCEAEDSRPLVFFCTRSACFLFLFRHFSFFSVFSPNCFSFNSISLSAQTFQLIVQLFKRKQYRALSSAHKVWKLRSQVKKNRNQNRNQSRKAKSEYGMSYWGIG